MSGPFNRKLSGMFGKIDNRILRAKLDAATEMLKSEDYEELAKKMANVDKQELMSKLDEIDEARLAELGMDKDEIAEKLNGVDMEKVAKLLGADGGAVITKIRKMLE